MKSIVILTYTVKILYICLCFLNASYSKLLRKSNELSYSPLKNLQPKMNTIDNVSFSDPDGITQSRIEFNIFIDMDNKIIKGYVRIFYICRNPTNEMRLDERNLNIEKVLDNEGEEMNFTIYKNTNNSIGDGLFVNFPKNCATSTGNDSFIDIYYHTNPNSLGLHFSDPSVLHNENKNYSFMYTHGEAIYGRTFFPSQDTPSMKITSSAKIRIKMPYAVLFSGEFISKHEVENNILEYNFDMNIPIPTYLISLSAGVMEKKHIKNSRCEVWGEKEALKWADKSFKYCEQYIQFYETYRPFAFKKMVFIIMPDDYPFSGMENPYNTYITEAVLSPDFSYTSTIAHEIVHFWSGNLVTNKDWRSFWLNEGITTYLSRKALGVVHGKETLNFELYGGIFKLNHALEHMKEDKSLDPSMRSLTPKISDDPYITFSRVPYEKGSFFMYYLETLLGNEVLHKILSSYFKRFEFKSIDSDTFISFLKQKILAYHPKGEKKLKEINWNEWLLGTESIPVDFNFKSKKVENFKKTLEIFKKGEKSVEEMCVIFSKMKIGEKDRVLKELIEDYKKLPENVISNLQKFVENDNIFNSHINVVASKQVLQSALMSDPLERKNSILANLDNLKFYKVQHLRKVFKLLKEINPNKKFLTDILTKFQNRFNPLTIQRLKEYIEIHSEKKKDKNS